MAALPIAGRVEAVVIGTSAGGVDALSTLLPALPRGLRPPVFVVLHLPRERPSLLPEIFAPKCAVPVREAVDKEGVEPGTVYFAPPDYHLLIEGGRVPGTLRPIEVQPALALSDDEPVHHSRPSIDVLFESAADVYGERLLAIVLSGGNADGADGARAVHDAGGVVIVQDPRTARVPVMPQSALERVTPDAVLPVAEISMLLNTLHAKEFPDDR